MSLQQRRLYVDPNTGKISLSQSLRNCERCRGYAREVEELRKTVFCLHSDLAMHRKQDAEMEILCKQIEKTKAKLAAKLSLRAESHRRVQSPCFLDSSGRQTQQCVRQQSLQLPMGVRGGRGEGFGSKELSTERSWGWGGN